MQRKLFFLFLEKKSEEEIQKLYDWMKVPLKKKKKIMRKSGVNHKMPSYSVKCIVDNDTARLRYTALEDKRTFETYQRFHTYIVHEFCYEEDPKFKNLLLDLFADMYGKQHIQDAYLDALTRLLKNFYSIHKISQTEYKQIISLSMARAVITYTLKRDDILQHYFAHYCLRHDLTSDHWYKKLIESIYDILRKGFHMPVLLPFDETHQPIIIHSN